MTVYIVVSLFTSVIEFQKRDSLRYRLLCTIDGIQIFYAKSDLSVRNPAQRARYLIPTVVAELHLPEDAKIHYAQAAPRSRESTATREAKKRTKAMF